MANTTPTQVRRTGQYFSQKITGLNPTTDYYFRAFATNAMGTRYGATLSFKTASGGSLASVVTLPATNIREGSAQLNGVVINDAGQAGDVRFQWGMDSSYGAETPWQGWMVTGSAFNATISPLSEGAAYHFRAQFRNRYGIVSGGDMVFSTLSPLGPVTFIEDDLLQLLEAV